MTDIITVDIETTGLCRNTSQIVDIGACHLFSKSTFQVECMPDLTKHYVFEEGASKVNGVDPDEFAFRVGVNYFEQKESVHHLIDWVKEVTEGRDFIIAGQNVAAFDMQILCRTITGDFNFNWSLGYRFLDIGSIFFAKYGYVAGSDRIAKELGLDPEQRPHKGLNGATHEAEVLSRLLF